MTNIYPCTALHCPPGQEGGREPVCGVGQGGGQAEHRPTQAGWQPTMHHVHWGSAMVRCGAVWRGAVLCSVVQSP